MALPASWITSYFHSFEYVFFRGSCPAGTLSHKILIHFSLSSYFPVPLTNRYFLTKTNPCYSLPTTPGDL